MSDLSDPFVQKQRATIVAYRASVERLEAALLELRGAYEDKASESGPTCSNDHWEREHAQWVVGIVDKALAGAGEPAEARSTEILRVVEDDEGKRLWLVPTREGGEHQEALSMAAEHFAVGATLTLEEPLPLSEGKGDG